MIIEILGAILLSAFVLYILFGGADYGAGILELFGPRNMEEKHEKIVTKALGPVWETNHIWLILIIVIFFTGFPPVYLALSTHLHIPMVAVLVGVVVRGVAFTFRHYDTFHGKPGRLYTLLFSWSSLWTSVWLGVTAGASLLGRIDPRAVDFYSFYIAPWWNIYCLVLGLFTTSVFSYIAASFLVFETQEKPVKSFFRRRARVANGVMLFFGGLVFIVAEWYKLPLATQFFSNIAAIGCVVGAAILWLLQMFWSSSSQRPRGALIHRALAAGQVVLILSGALMIQYPKLIETATGPLTLQNSAAPEATLNQLLLALVVGLILIFPSIGILFWIFKFERSSTSS